MIKFEDIKPELATLLKELGVPEKNLFNHYSDLYIGCNGHAQASRIARESSPKGGLFKPQEGSDMDHFSIAVDIPFSYYPYKNDRSKF
jgi:hypothetical protein